VYAAPIDRRLYYPIVVRTQTVGDSRRTIDATDMFPYGRMLNKELPPFCLPPDSSNATSKKKNVAHNA
jgi:hypothetical protein